MASTIDIDTLIKIVSNGGKVTTGIDIYNNNGTLLLDKAFVVTSTKTLQMIKENGIKKVPLSADGKSGIWNAEGLKFSTGPKSPVTDPIQTDQSYIPPISPGVTLNGLGKRLYEIEENRKLAQENYKVAKQCIKKALTDIKNNGGQFDHAEVSDHVSRLAGFLTIMDNPFSYLTREILSYDDYLYNHSINVCAIGTAIMNKFNTVFSTVISGHLNSSENEVYDPFNKSSGIPKITYRHFQKDELQSISLGFFLHDIGKVMVPDAILNKPDKLTDEEFDTVKKHSHELGLSILEKNKLNNPFIINIVTHHHSALYLGEANCYPSGRLPEEIPLYAKICKLADMYDAMTSKRSYKEAFNQINVVTEIFRTYARKDALLQYILQSFIKSIGIYPPGSIVFLRNGQMGYVLESKGPLVIPFTNADGNRLSTTPAPLDIGAPDCDDAFKIDNRRSIKNPLEVYDLLPPYLRSGPSKTEKAQAMSA
ncbi:MAG: HD domain-containing protein [Desulfobacula sp.]|nr:HD domain-containing protein [Desulfobacula sp.]